MLLHSFAELYLKVMVSSECEYWLIMAIAFVVYSLEFLSDFVQLLNVCRMLVNLRGLLIFFVVTGSR